MEQYNHILTGHSDPSVKFLLSVDSGSANQAHLRFQHDRAIDKFLTDSRDDSLAEFGSVSFLLCRKWGSHGTVAKHKSKSNQNSFYVRANMHGSETIPKSEEGKDAN